MANRLVGKIFLGLVFILFAFAAEATHLVGGYTAYKYLGSNGQTSRYRVTLYVYRDCSNDGDPKKKVPFDTEISLCVYANNNLYDNFTIRLISERSVPPVGNTSCPEVAQACLKQGIYEGDIDLANSTSGYKLKWERCCRNTQENLKDNSQNQPYQGQAYYAEIPATALKNSSPVFSQVPVPFICAGDTTTIRNAAVDQDSDADSLSYSFDIPWQGADDKDPVPNCTQNFIQPISVEYRSGFNVNRPFGNGGISYIDPYGGLTTYMAPAPGRYAVAVVVTEWRNGIPISHTRLDLQILVISCKPNNKPRLSYEGGTKTWIIEEGGTLCKTVTATDQDATDYITLKGYGDIFTGANGYNGTRATLNPITAMAQKTVNTRFCWKTDCNSSRPDPYRVTFEATDDGCPSKFINENVLIYVTPFAPPEQPTGPKNVCQYEKNVAYRLTNQVFTNKYVWRVVGGTIQGDSTRPTVYVDWGSGTGGSVSLYITSRYGCSVAPRTISVVIIPSPGKPNISGKDTVCLNTTAAYTSTADPGVIYQWTVKGGNILGSSTTDKATVYWNVKGNGFITLTVKNAAGCFSPTDSIYVFVSHPNTAPIQGPNSICPNNSNIDYTIGTTTPGSVYRWVITGGVQSAGGMSNAIKVDWGGKGIGWVKVVEINRFGCPGDTVSLQVIIDHALKGQMPVGDTSICEFTKGMGYSITPVFGETYTWFVTGGTIISGQSSPSIIVDWGAAGVGSVGVQSTAYDPVNNLPCASPVKARIVNIRPVPKNAKINGNLEVCQDPGEGSFSVVGFAGSTYEWEVLGHKFAGQGKSTITIPLDTFGSFTIRVQETTMYGCKGPWNDTVLIIHPKPRTTAITGQLTICYPNLSGYNYSVTGFAGSTYQWIINGGVVVNGNGTSNITVDWNGQQYSKIVVIETSDFGCIGDSIAADVFIDNPAIYCDLVTVNPPPGDDKSTILYYNLTNAPRYNKLVVIQRRLKGSLGPFGTIGYGQPNEIFYTDYTALTDSLSYEYRAVAINLCGDSLYSNQHTDILLKAKKTGAFSYRLNFTDYKDWPGGVKQYELYRLLENRTPYQLYNVFNDTITIAYNNGKEHYGMWFRVKAIENGGLNRESWSNDVVVYFEPVIFIPNAFTPERNGLNDVFLPNSGGMKSYEMLIYNRWGEKLFETPNNEIGWDGTYLGKPVPEGIYVYVINYTDYRNQQYQAKGTLHLMR